MEDVVSQRGLIARSHGCPELPRSDRGAPEKPVRFLAGAVGRGRENQGPAGEQQSEGIVDGVRRFALYLRMWGWDTSECKMDASGVCGGVGYGAVRVFKGLQKSEMSML